MRKALGESNITIIVLLLIGVVAVAGAILIPRMTNNTIYVSCCNEAGGNWTNGSCTVNTPEKCTEKEEIWKEYNSCVVERGKSNASNKYRTTQCKD